MSSFIVKLPYHPSHLIERSISSLRGVKRRGNPVLKFKQNLKSELPRRFASRNDEKMLSQILFTEISNKKKIRQVVRWKNIKI
jgi:hypothetical protein